jgi:hypothetical protein
MRMNMMAAGLSLALAAAVSPASAQVGSAPPRCTCSEGQELTDVAKPVRSVTLTVWNCTCGESQCVIAQAPTSQAAPGMHCAARAIRREEPAAAPVAPQETRKRSQRDRK